MGLRWLIQCEFTPKTLPYSSPFLEFKSSDSFSTHYKKKWNHISRPFYCFIPIRTVFDKMKPYFSPFWTFCMFFPISPGKAFHTGCPISIKWNHILRRFKFLFPFFSPKIGSFENETTYFAFFAASFSALKIFLNLYHGFRSLEYDFWNHIFRPFWIFTVWQIKCCFLEPYFSPLFCQKNF